MRALILAVSLLGLADPTLAVEESPTASGTSAYARTRKVGPSCDPPTVLNPRTKNCDLQDDADGLIDGKVVLTDTLSLSSFTRLNCKGLTLVPAVPGVVDVRSTSASEYTASTPEVAILVKEAWGVKVLDCVIGTVGAPFDFGVFVLGAKLPAEARDDAGARALLANKILGNTVTTRYAAAVVVKSDNTTFADNDITFGIGSRPQGGVLLSRDSDDNRIVDNRIQRHASHDIDTNAPPLPQRAVQFAQGASVVFTQPFPDAVLNFVFDGALTQVPFTASMLIHPAATWRGPCTNPSGAALGGTCNGMTTVKCTDDFDCGLRTDGLTPDGVPERNIIEGNTIDSLAGPIGIATQTMASVDQVIRGNLVKRTSTGINFNDQATLTLAGTCSGNSGQYCGVDADCRVTGTNFGTCDNERTLRNPSLGAKSPRVEGNAIVGPVDGSGIGVLHGAIGVSVVANDVSGALIGALVDDTALESTLVTRNRFHDNTVGLQLLLSPSVVTQTRPISTPHFFGSVFTRNDFTGTQSAIELESFPFGADLNGNYWGRACADSEGFRDANELNTCTHDSTISCTQDTDCGVLAPGSTCITSTDSPSTLVTDGHPYGQSVADTANSELPAACK